MLKELGKSERILLLKFVCAFAWADLEVKKSERDLIHRLMQKLELDPEERAEVERCLKRPPKPEEVDPNRIPRAHRDLFLKAARQVIAIDGEVDPAERENLELLEQLLA